MTTERNRMPEPAKTLREQAENLLHTNPADMLTIPTKDAQTLVHELNVHQMELEIQNEELRQAQLELAHSRDLYSDLYEFAPVGYLTLDRTGCIRQANLTAAKLLRVERQQLTDCYFSKFMSADDADLLHLHLFRVFESGSSNVCDLQLVRQDAAPCNVRLESVKIDGQKPPVCWTIMSDITELTQAQQAAAASRTLAALGTLAAGIAHEVNNPLWMISLEAQVALEAFDTPGGKQIVTDCLKKIGDLVERGGRIVNSTLRFAKQDTTQKWPHSLVEVLRRARDYTRGRAAVKNVSVELQMPDAVPDIAMNSTEMEQVFVNLLNNAIDASQANGRVLVDVRVNAEHVTAGVEDQGRGMSPEESNRIFDPFYTTRRDEGGTGLGLSITHRIVEDHDGTIEIVSQRGKGTAVTVKLPMTT